jgi:peptide/nickel transport system substrate-binding protein
MALLDRGALAGLAGSPWAPAVSLVPGGLLGAPAVAVPPAAAEKAANLLASAGWSQGADGILRRGGQPLEVRLTTYEGSPWYEQLATEIAGALREAGMAVRLVGPRRVTEQGLVSGAANAWLLRYDWPDPDALYYLFHSAWAGATNRWRYAEPVADGLLETGRRTMSPASRAQVYREVDARIRADAVAAGLLEPSGALWISPRVAGLRNPALGRLEWSDLYLRSR